jgi:beta-galactosidase
MHIGVDYYPEHWGKERWEIDAQMMKKAGFNVVRLAEFAWAKMEPSEGKYELDWLDEAIKILSGYGIKVILGTPTGSRPPWLARKYPETTAVDITGHRISYGGRKDNCPTSKTYRRLSSRITEVLAEHYAGEKAVIGWQTDNEFACPVCYCGDCEAAWHNHLKSKYRTLNELNRRWGTVFWGHIYSDWEEIPLPRKGQDNPSLSLEHRRFHSLQVVSFQREQVEILRRITPDRFITHNFMGFSPWVDYYDLAGDLDFVSWDCYYNYSSWSERLNNYSLQAAGHDLMRSLKKRNFWIMETSAGPVGNRMFSRNLRPGELRRMGYQTVAHGADGLLWFRWRTSLYGFEQYWHGLLGHDGVPGRRYREASLTSDELQKLSGEIEGSRVKSEVAIFYSYDDRWAFEIQPNFEKFDYVSHLLCYYKALQKEGVNVDFTHLNSSLDGYRLLILPAPYIVREEAVQKLKEFVNKGGILLLTFRSGVKNEDNIPTEKTLPGLFRDLAGVRVEEYEALEGSWKVSYSVTPGVSYSVELDGKIFPCCYTADWVVPENAKVICRYREKHLKDYAAVTVNHLGAGRVYYVGTYFSIDEAYSLLLKKILKGVPLKRYFSAPYGVEVYMREKGSKHYAFILNHNEKKAEVKINNSGFYMDIISGNTVKNKITLPAGEVAVLKF